MQTLALSAGDFHFFILTSFFRQLLSVVLQSSGKTVFIHILNSFSNNHAEFRRWTWTKRRRRKRTPANELASFWGGMSLRERLAKLSLIGDFSLKQRKQKDQLQSICFFVQSRESLFTYIHAFKQLNFTF